MEPAGRVAYSGGVPAPQPPWDDLDPEHAAALFGDAPTPPLSLVPPTPRMRSSARRRARNARADAVVDVPTADPRLPAPAPAAPAALTVPSEPPPSSFIQAQRDAMRAIFAQTGVTLAALQVEMLAVARAAAAEGEYQAAGGIYKTIAQTLGAINGDKHLHLHGGSPANPLDPKADFRSASDQALYALIARAKQQEQVRDAAVVPSPAPTPAEISAPAPVEAPLVTEHAPT